MLMLTAELICVTVEVNGFSDGSERRCAKFLHAVGDLCYINNAVGILCSTISANVSCQQYSGCSFRCF